MTKNDAGAAIVAITAVSAVVIEIFGERFFGLWVLCLIIILLWDWE